MPRLLILKVKLMKTLALLNFLVSLTMMGIIIVTQIVSYPMFLNVNKQNFTTFHSEYVKRITSIVMPIMILELAISVTLFFMFDGILAKICLITLILIFISTGLIQVPIHEKLKVKYDEYLTRKLIKSNWIRTSLWTVKSFASYNIIIKELF